MKKLEARKKLAIMALIALVGIDALVWHRVVSSLAAGNLEMHFLDVGQGDSELLLLPSPGGRGTSVSILIDGGTPNGKAVQELSKLLPQGTKHIDLVIMTHPQLDHFGGLIQVLDMYTVGAFIGSGREGTAQAYSELSKKMREKNVPYVTLGAGSVIRYRDSTLTILGPTKEQRASDELNDTTVVALLEHGDVQALFTGDIGALNEEGLISSVSNLQVDVLKVAHHGSRFSSSQNFLHATKPRLAVIEVGKNSYGHPTPQTVSRLEAVGAEVLRTDKNGTVSIISRKNALEVFASKSE